MKAKSQSVTVWVIAMILLSVMHLAGTAGAQTPASALNLVVIGDSIPFGGFCTQCEHAFVDDYALRLGEQLGVEINVINRSRDDGAVLNQIVDQVANESLLRDQLSTADIVIVSAGFNDGPPWTPDHMCGGTSDDSMEALVAQILTYTDDCVAEAIRARESDYDRLFSEIDELVSDSAQVFIITPYDAWTGWPGFNGVLTSDELARLTNLFSQFLTGWNQMECGVAESHGFRCVDLYHAFNGPDGSSPAGDLLEEDYTHPSKKGNALIADLLIDQDTYGSPAATPSPAESSSTP